MRKATKFFIAGVGVATTVATLGLYFARPSVSREELIAIAFLSALAVIGELWAFVLSREARGSIAFIPYLATVLIVPSWVSVVAVVGVKAFTETRARVDPPKALFNAFLQGRSQATAIALYTSLGGARILDGASPPHSPIRTAYGRSSRTT